jgi:hypothetical protein
MFWIRLMSYCSTGLVMSRDGLREGSSLLSASGFNYLVFTKWTGIFNAFGLSESVSIFGTFVMTASIYIPLIEASGLDNRSKYMWYLKYIQNKQTKRNSQ